MATKRPNNGPAYIGAASCALTTEGIDVRSVQNAVAPDPISDTTRADAAVCCRIGRLKSAPVAGQNGGEPIADSSVMCSRGEDWIDRKF